MVSNRSGVRTGEDSSMWNIFRKFLGLPVRRAAKKKDRPRTSRREVRSGGAVAAHQLHGWWDSLAPAFQNQLRRAWKHSCGGLDQGAFAAGSASGLNDMYSFGLELDRAQQVALALDLVASLVNAGVGRDKEPELWSGACAWLAHRHWQLGYESAERLRTEGIHNQHLQLAAEYGEKAATAALLPDIRSGKVTSCPGLDTVFMLYEIAGLSAEGCRLVQRLERSGMGGLVEVERYRDAFCLWPAWCQAIIAIQAASPKRMAFKAALEQAIASGVVPAAAAQAQLERLRSVAKSLRG